MVPYPGPAAATAEVAGSMAAPARSPSHQLEKLGDQGATLDGSALGNAALGGSLFVAAAPSSPLGGLGNVSNALGWPWV